MKIAYLTGRAWRGKPMRGDELPSIEAADFDIIAPLARERGMDFDIRHWDDPALSEEGFAAALIRSCWDYPERADEFAATLEKRELQGLRVINPSSVVRWNARKTYLRGLEEAGVRTIPTAWSERLDASQIARAFDDFDTAELVIKPQVGAGSRATLRLKRNAWSETDLALGPQGPAMTQPFFPAIETAGEFSLFYFGGAFSHAVNKTPAPGHWFANAMDARFVRWTPDAAALDMGAQTLAASPRDCLYGRVDLVRDPAGAWRLIEFEAIEPYLFIAHAPEGAPRFVEALFAALA